MNAMYKLTKADIQALRKKEEYQSFTEEHRAAFFDRCMALDQ